MSESATSGDRPAKVPPTPKLSATILLLRDGDEGLEVFMVQRHHQIDFATGAMVFPGGKVDPGDDAARTRACCSGADGLSDDEITLRVAAIRETFEESGVLLARAGGGTDLIDANRLATLEKQHRQPLQDGSLPMAELAQKENLVYACDLLVPFAHWITPVFMPKRFDTHFFIAVAPQDHVALHDGSESVDSVWTTIPGALEAESSGRRTIIFPTLVNLRKLGRATSVADAITRATAKPIVTVLPTIGKNEAGEKIMMLPEDADYDVVTAPLESLR